MKELSGEFSDKLSEIGQFTQIGHSERSQKFDIYECFLGR